MATANMGLTLPDVSVTPGPTWASQINSNLSLIDAHNHTDTNGARIPTAGLSIDAELKFNNTAPNGLPASGLSRLGLLAPQTPPLATGVYSDASGDLYYDNGAAQVQITSGNNIVGTAGSISGMTPESSASFNGGTGTFLWQKDAALSEAASMDHGPLRLRDGTAGASAITITPPSGLASAYTLTLPSALPAQQSLLGTSTGGAQSNVAVDSTLTLTSSLLKVANLGVGTAQLADGAVSSTKLATNSVVTAKIADGNVTQVKWGPKTVASSSSVSASTTSLTQVAVPGLSVSLSARAGRAIKIEVIPSGFGTSRISCGSSSGGYISLLQILPSSDTLCDLYQGAENQPVNSICAVVLSPVNAVYTFAVYWFVNSSGYSLNIDYAKIIAYEL